MTARTDRPAPAENVSIEGWRPARTIARPADLEGIGLHTGERVHVRFRPAAAGVGIVFIREDLPEAPRIPVSLANLVEKPRRTAVASGGAEIHTVEHLLAVLYVLGITDIEIGVSGDELPGVDGSALPFWETLSGAGRDDLGPGPATIRIREPISVAKGDAHVVAIPADGGLWIDYTLDYGRDILPQHITFHLTEEAFAREIAPARTFILHDEIQPLRAAGLGRGATYQNTLVYQEGKVIENELRFPDEFVRHKVLDVIGDISFAGRPVVGRLVACRSGHRLNVELARRLSALPPESPAPWPIERIMGVLPHRYPFLMIDRILEIVPERRAVGFKNVTMDEGFFQGHFPGRPVMPGVLQIEAMAQLAGVLLLSDASRADQIAFLMSLDRVKFRRPVVPGDRLMLRVEVTKLRSRTGEILAEAQVDGQVVAEAEIRFMLIPR